MDRSLRLDEFREGFVGRELQCRERDRHGEGGRVGDVKGAQALSAEDFARAVDEGGVSGAVHLHALFDDVEGVHEGVAGDGRAGAGGGCISSSLLVMFRGVEEGIVHTSCYGMMSRGISAHGLLDDFVGGKVDGVGGACEE